MKDNYKSEKLKEWESFRRIKWKKIIAYPEIKESYLLFLDTTDIDDIQSIAEGYKNFKKETEKYIKSINIMYKEI